jgi:hypothetical protein
LPKALPTGSCEQRRKHSNVALPPRICQFFLLYFAATLSPQSVTNADRTGWLFLGAAMRTPLPILAQLPKARALVVKIATR